MENYNYFCRNNKYLMQKLSFSGHETFVCKQYWLKKGIDFVRQKGSFNQESSVVSLGVGKNMVVSIKYWLKSFNLLDNHDNLTELAKYIFGSKGKDPYIEDIGTIWLLHYNLVKTAKATIYNMFFNEFSKDYNFFEKEHITKYILNILRDLDIKNINTNTIDKDINVLLRSYYKDETSKDIEEDSVILLSELEIIKKEKKSYYLNYENKQDIPENIFLFAILEFLSKDESTVSINRISFSNSSPGRIFLLNKHDVIEKIRLLEAKYKGIVYSSQAGVETIQFKKSIDKWKVLDDYYNS
ncbi:DUF4007 family protein [Flavobacterium filum]|uniref:DUF4007 family protein n=1 Tax=Flavobacterium filum TaxID=370974 RepID=UPI0023F1517C|nr:DUF4007 family protein [Flavobacterium filum]